MRTILCAGALFLWMGTVAAEDVTFRKAREYLRSLHDPVRTPGISAAVSRDGVIVLSMQLGMADPEAGTRVTPGTLFPIGSVNKPMTAALAVLLAQHGVIDLDSPARRYVPSFPHVVTVRQLLQHLACIRHYRPTEWIIGIPFASLTDATELFRDDPLACEPGSRFLYSDYGYALLGAVVESAVGRSFADLMKERLLDPFAMKDTHPDLSPSERVRSYLRAEDGIAPAPETNATSRLASGGYVSTPADLLRFAHGVMTSSVFDNRARSLLFTPGVTSRGVSTHYGFGWRIGRDTRGRRVYFHGGDPIGGRAFLLMYPDSGVAVALCANAPFGFGIPEAARLAEPFLLHK